jgi:NAD(P)-dependent dehydrogenase (short-subunit alcohol dehydrogenase family)
MRDFKDKVAVITGAASGFGREFARIGARLGMKLVLADVQEQPLEVACAELASSGARVVSRRVDVSKGDEVEALCDAAYSAFGATHLLFNNAGVSAGGLVWENTVRDWEWMLGVNLWGVIHGVRVFTPRMLEAASADPSYRGHIVNTASMAGLVNAPAMGLYNVAKHGVVSLSETLHHDLGLVTTQIRCSVLCPYFIATGISDSHRNRPESLMNDTPPTRSQRVAQALAAKAVTSGKVTAEQFTEAAFEAIRAEAFWVMSHPHALGAAKTALDEMLAGRNPPDPFAERPDVRAKLVTALSAPSE